LIVIVALGDVFLSSPRLCFKVITFGCQMNQSRSEHIEYLLKEAGFRACLEGEEPDIVVFNTCAVREHAKNRAVSIIGQFASQKRKDGFPIILVCGCMSQIYQEKLLHHVPNIDVLLGTHNLEEVPFLIQERLKEQKDPQPRLAFRPKPEGQFLETGYSRKPGVSAFLPITYGCNNFCSYCVVPYATGPQRSKPMELILEELQKILEEGFKEVTLLGQNVNSYGEDLGLKWGFEKLLENIEKLVEEKPSRAWIRFITSHPKDMRESIVDLVKESKVLCPYFHLPIQAGSNKILELMNRGYTKERYLEIASYIRDTIPDASIGTDIIVGFPEETEADFRQTLEVVEKVQFEIAYTFAYSPRPKTRASSMADSVPPQEKKRRLLELNQLVREVYQKRVEKLRGKTVALLVDKQEKTFSGRTPSNLRVFVESGVKDSLKPGDMLLVKITEIRDGKIFAEKA